MVKKNFDITSKLPVSKLFTDRHIVNFADACTFIKNLPYGRNANKNDLTTIFADNCGTCSTKHALLKQLAIENNADFVCLKLALFNMNGDNTPEIAQTLDQYGLQYIPEAHNYLTVNGQFVDCTKQNSPQDKIMANLYNEIEIEPKQITGFKVSYHQTFLKDWLLNNPDITFDLAELWSIREKCIADLSFRNNPKG